MNNNLKYQNSFRHLIVWQEAKKLTLFIYTITKTFPTEEKFAMTSQIRRAAYSIMANIAEGNSKKYHKGRCNFFDIAKGSLNEVDSFGEIAKELKYINEQNYNKLMELINKVGYLLNKFINSQK